MSYNRVADHLWTRVLKGTHTDPSLDPYRELIQGSTGVDRKRATRRMPAVEQCGLAHVRLTPHLLIRGSMVRVHHGSLEKAPFCGAFCLGSVRSSGLEALWGGECTRRVHAAFARPAVSPVFLPYLPDRVAPAPTLHFSDAAPVPGRHRLRYLLYTCPRDVPCDVLGRGVSRPLP